MGWDTLISVSGTIIATLLGVYLRFYLKRKKEEKEQDPVVDDIHMCNEIDNFLGNILNELRADRILVFQFHNGGHYYTGKDIQKISATFESRAEGISQEKHNFINLIVSHYTKFLKELIESNYYIRRDVMAISDSPVRNLLLPRGVKSVCCVPIYSINDKFVGFMSIEYVKSKMSNFEEIKEYTKEVSNRLSGYLTD